MGTRHVTELLSAAYDGELTVVEQRRYEEHLAACADCTAAAEQFRQAIDAVHAMPAAPMPQRVVLPSTPPQVERGRGLVAPLLDVLRRARPALRLTPAWGAGVMAAAGIVAVVLVVHGNGGGSPSSTSLARPQLQQGIADNNQGAAVGGKRAAIGVGTCPLPQAVVTAQPGPAAANPPGFANRVVVSNPQRPGEELVLATTSGHYAAGSQVLVYAALTTSSGQRATVIPCVTLHAQGAVAFLPGASTYGTNASGGGQASSADSAQGSASTTGGNAASSTPTSPAPGSAMQAAPNAAVAPPAASLLTPEQLQAFAPFTLQPPLAIAAPTAAAVANLPLQVLQIPANLPPGTQLRLVALIPAGLPGSGDSSAIEAVLTFDVS
jgi:hypothetical protein